MQTLIGFPDRTRRSERLLACLLAALLALPPAAVAQQPPATPVPQTLKVIPLAGNNAFNDLERGVFTPLVVQVLDQNDLPVEGAEVVFRFPVGGATGAFANQQTSQTTKSSSTGQARAEGWTANSTVGSFRVRVTATRGNEQGETFLAMTNVNRISDVTPRQRGHWWTSKWALLTYLAAGAAIGTSVALSGRNGGPGSTTITATPGAPSIGGPQ